MHEACSAHTVVHKRAAQDMPGLHQYSHTWHGRAWLKFRQGVLCMSGACHFLLAAPRKPRRSMCFASHLFNLNTTGSAETHKGAVHAVTNLPEAPHCAASTLTCSMTQSRNVLLSCFLQRSSYNLSTLDAWIKGLFFASCCRPAAL